MTSDIIACTGQIAEGSVDTVALIAPKIRRSSNSDRLLECLKRYTMIDSILCLRETIKSSSKRQKSIINGSSAESVFPNTISSCVLYNSADNFKDCFSTYSRPNITCPKVCLIYINSYTNCSRFDSRLAKPDNPWSSRLRTEESVKTTDVIHFLRFILQFKRERRVLMTEDVHSRNR
ncbi:hypothetical protein BDF20DRAFT_833757 [Mycotypha africana]|uniref:uncharacterized protein n=1 Tax=Mycotypha africana TaxID=64632 RepID=UPI00230086B2|nr:uncharacterized protein BDF20DRAFT_833757 [Mycotypha africana]KAI8984229.1 hypothetical protein BDF20DRAFT_833757 [Mycotypha africana]